MDTLTYDARDGVGWVRLNRPKKRNPFDSELRRDLFQVLEKVREDPSVRVLVLAGCDGAFSSGGNLNELKEHSAAGPTYWHQRLRNGLRLIQDLTQLTRPVIAVVDGPAFGAGFALALTADIILATPRARFSMAHLRLGLVPDLGALYTLPRAVGLQRAKEIVFSTREIGAEEAHAMGLVMEVHEVDQVEARARDIAASMTKAAPAAVALTKSALNISLDSDQATMFALEASSQAAAFSAKEPAQAISAILDKQAPPFAWPGPGIRKA